MFDATIANVRKERNMKRVRILLASMPMMLMEMVAGIIEREPEFVIVGTIAECSDLTSAVRRSQADLLIIGQSSLTETDLTAVLSSSYPAKILAITENGQGGTLNELRPHRETFVDISAASIIAAIRTAIGPRDFKPTLQ
jgi:hypothetical protein